MAFEHSAIVQGDVYRDFLATLPVLRSRLREKPGLKSTRISINYGTFHRILSTGYGDLALKNTDSIVSRWAPGMRLRAVAYESDHETYFGYLYGRNLARVIFEYARRADPHTKD